MNKRLAALALGLAIFLHLVIKCNDKELKAENCNGDDSLVVAEAMPMG